jgi:hypothetical protein
MEKEFVPYELALRLKALGFNEPCFGYYKAEYEDGINPLPVNLILEQNKASSNVFYKTSAPTWQQAFRWFRENYNLISSIDTIIYGCTLNEQEFHYKIITNTGFGSYGQFGTYEEAELECLKKLLEIVESKTK